MSAVILQSTSKKEKSMNIKIRYLDQEFEEQELEVELVRIASDSNVFFRYHGHTDLPFKYWGEGLYSACESLGEIKILREE
jgi:hypothetical protein